jgi:hypothetical protein
MSQQLTLQILRVTFPTLRSLHSLICEVKFREIVERVAVSPKQHPFSEPVSFREAGLSLDESIEMRFYADDSPLGIVVLNFKEHFQFALEGEFDKWVQVKTFDRVRDSSSMRSLYDEGLSKRGEDSPERQPHVRVKLSIEAPDTPEEAEYSDEEQTEPIPVDPAERPEASSPHCARCAYLEKLTLTQKNELKCKD